MLGRQIAFGGITAVLVGCSADTPAPTALELRAPVFAVRANSDINLGTHLTGDEEVFVGSPGAPTPADSKAQGQAIFRVNDDGTVDFRLIASNIDNVFMAHIHCGRAGTNGPIRMWLYPNIGPTGTPGAAGSGPQNGVLASGTFTPGAVTCPQASVGRLPTDPPMPLLDAIRGGFTYVNVHTNDGMGLPNSGPGDFPGGEIRGQIDHENH